MRAWIRLVALSASVPLGLALALIPTGSANAGSFVAVAGSGSSFAAIAINQWALDVRPRGLIVNYDPDGSDAGRADYITNLRLSGSTAMKIFTGQITNWDDPQITHDYGSQLPNLPITPVIHSDLAGSTLYLSSWLSAVFPSQWNAFCTKVDPHIKPPCGPTVAYPRFGRTKAEDGSNNVASYIASSAGNGAIGYDEVSYVLAAHIPELALGNAAGDFVSPTAANIKASLRRANIPGHVRAQCPKALGR